ncbi:MAG: MurR/RpiR family transcriptional regulator, partial [Ramlibacter sp.]
MTPRVLEKIAEIMDRAPAARRTVLALILQDPQRVLDETFEALAQRANSSVPTIMRACRDLGFPGLREFKLALAQELAVGGSPLNRRVRLDDDTRQVIAKVTRGAATVINGVQAQLDVQAVQAAADTIVGATRVDCYGVGVTSNFMASDLQARLYRM